MTVDMGWATTLTTAEIRDLKHAVDVAIARGKPLLELTVDDFPLAILHECLRALSVQLEDGRGFELWRGLPVADWPPARRPRRPWHRTLSQRITCSAQ